MQFMDVMAPLAALHIIRHHHSFTKTFNPQHKAGAQFTDQKGWKDESSLRVPRPGVESGPLASEASVLPLNHLLSCVQHVQLMILRDPLY